MCLKHLQGFIKCKEIALFILQTKTFIDQSTAENFCWIGGFSNMLCCLIKGPWNILQRDDVDGIGLIKFQEENNAQEVERLWNVCFVI